MTRLDYKKAYYMFPQTWIIEYLKMSKISDKLINVISNAMENREMELTVEGKPKKR